MSGNGMLTVWHSVSGCRSTRYVQILRCAQDDNPTSPVILSEAKDLYDMIRTAAHRTANVLFLNDHTLMR